MEYYSGHDDKITPCTVQVGRQVTATSCATRCSDKLLLVYRRIFVKIFRLRNRILSPQQVAQIQSDFCIPIPSPDGYVEGRCKCVASLNVHLWCNFTVTSANQTALYSAFVWLCPIYSDTWCLNCASVLGKEMFFCVFRFVIHSDGMCRKLGFNGRRYALLPTFYKQDLYWFSFYHLAKKVPKWFLISFYYAAGSVSGRNEGQLSVDWLSERAWWPILSTRDYLLSPASKLLVLAL